MLKQIIKKIIITDLISPIRTLRMYNYTKNYKNILMIGAGGRDDWKYLEGNGLNVTVLDIRKIDGPKRFIQQSITEQTPFEDNEFDCIALSTVLEYTIDDITVLKELKRVLSDDGIIICDVVYLSEKASYPIRLYSRKTLSDIFLYTGFEVEYTEKWGFFNFLYNRYPFRLIMLLFTIFIKDYNRWLKIDIYLSNKFSILDKILNYHNGDLLICNKSNSNFKFYQK
jgi:SAM-dependent methyltransferase